MTDASTFPVVIVESPYAGNIEQNLIYAKRACIDCLRRGEVPYASHLFFTQFLNDLEPVERELGLTAGYALWGIASKIVFYIDYGFSNGMLRAKERAQAGNLIIEERKLG